MKRIADGKYKNWALNTNKTALRAIKAVQSGKQPSKSTPKWILQGLEEAGLLIYTQNGFILTNPF